MLSAFKKKKGFTLIELLVVIAILAILLVIVLVAVNPAKQTRDARNTQRRADVLTVLNAVNQYFIENGTFPAGGFPTCPTTAAIGTGGEDIAADVVPDFVAALPKDPQLPGTDADTGYDICQSAGDRVTVSAPETEGGAGTISATR
jgi:prepilin-type N-terminal cleavage/methylation domain-containing protein